MDRQGLYVSIPNARVRWLLKRAALDRECTVRALVLGILTDWLGTHGYEAKSTADEPSAATA